MAKTDPHETKETQTDADKALKEALSEISSNVSSIFREFSKGAVILCRARRITRLKFLRCVSKGNENTWLKSTSGHIWHLKVTPKQINDCTLFSIPELLAKSGWRRADDPVLRILVENELQKINFGELTGHISIL